MKHKKKTKVFYITKHMMAIVFAFILAFSAMSAFSQSEVFAAKAYNPTGEWGGTNEMAGGHCQFPYIHPQKGILLGIGNLLICTDMDIRGLLKKHPIRISIN